jgi:hypothetical protein
LEEIGALLREIVSFVISLCIGMRRFERTAGAPQRPSGFIVSTSINRKEPMKLNQQLKDMLLKVNTALPMEKRAEFVDRVRQRLSHIQVDDLAGYTIAGALVGAVCEILPLDTITGIDDWVEVGAAFGAAVGYFVSRKERQARKDIEQIIAEEVNRALVGAH